MAKESGIGAKFNISNGKTSAPTTPRKKVAKEAQTKKPSGVKKQKTGTKRKRGGKVEMKYVPIYHFLYPPPLFPVPIFRVLENLLLYTDSSPQKVPQAAPRKNQEPIVQEMKMRSKPLTACKTTTALSAKFRCSALEKKNFQL
jgi:hypothetical protein